MIECMKNLHEQIRGVPLSAWLLLAVSWLTFLLAYTGRQAIYSIFPVLKNDLGFSNAQLGLTGSIFLWVYSFGSPLGGLVGDRFPYAAVAQWSVIIWSLTSVATGFSTTPEMVLGLRALLGITQCVFVPAALAAIASVHSGTTRSKAFAIWGTGQLSGVVLGGWYGGFVAERLDWRWVFWLVGAFGVAYGFLLGPVIRRLVPSEGKERAGSSQTSTPSGSGNPLNLFRTPTFSLFALSFFIFCAMLWVIYAWLPTFFVEKFAFSLTSAGLTATLSVQLTTALGLLAGGVVADKLIARFKEARIWILITGMLGTAPCLHLLANAPTSTLTQSSRRGVWALQRLLCIECNGLCAGCRAPNTTRYGRRSHEHGRRHLRGLGCLHDWSAEERLRHGSDDVLGRCDGHCGAYCIACGCVWLLSS